MITVATADQQPIPVTTQLCLSGQDVDVCAHLFPITSGFMARAIQPTITTTVMSPSRVLIDIYDLPAGSYTVRLIDIAPYDDISWELDVDGASVSVLPLMLFRPTPGQQVARDTLALPGMTIEKSAPLSEPVQAATANDVAPRVSALPNSGVAPDGGRVTDALLVTGAVAGLAAVSWLTSVRASRR